MWSSRVARTNTGTGSVAGRPARRGRQRAGLAQLVLQVGMAQVVAVHRPRQVRAVGVPVQEVERRGRCRRGGSCSPRTARPGRSRAGWRTRTPGPRPAGCRLRRSPLRARRPQLRRRRRRSARCPRSRASSRERWRLRRRAHRPSPPCTASAAPSSVPPTQKPSAFTSIRLCVISLATAQGARIRPSRGNRPR